MMMPIKYVLKLTHTNTLWTRVCNTFLTYYSSLSFMLFARSNVCKYIYTYTVYKPINQQRNKHCPLLVMCLVYSWQWHVTTDKRTFQIDCSLCLTWVMSVSFRALSYSLCLAIHQEIETCRLQSRANLQHIIKFKEDLALHLHRQLARQAQL